MDREGVDLRNPFTKYRLLRYKSERKSNRNFTAYGVSVISWYLNFILQVSYFYNEDRGIVINIQNCIQEMLGSNVGRNSGYSYNSISTPNLKKFTAIKNKSLVRTAHKR
jgi:hypothetical protein